MNHPHGPIRAALADTVGVFMPSAGQGRDGIVTVSLGAKGVIESANPDVEGWDGAVMSYVNYLFELAGAAAGTAAP